MKFMNSDAAYLYNVTDDLLLSTLYYGRLGVQQMPAKAAER